MGFEKYENLADETLHGSEQETSSASGLGDGHISEQEVINTLQGASRITEKKEDDARIQIGATNVLRAIFGGTAKQETPTPTETQGPVVVPPNSVAARLSSFKRMMENPPKKPDDTEYQG